MQSDQHNNDYENVGEANMDESPPRPGSRARVWKRRLLSLLVGSLIGFATAEVALRLLRPQHLSPLLAWVEKPGFEDLIVADEQMGWRMAPGYKGRFFKDTHVEINSLGLRDHEYGEKQEGEFRILSLGDSYAFGHGVELNECYAKQLEALLQTEYPKTVIRVISGGVDGYNTDQTAMELARLMPILKPDFVMSTFVAGNDVAENALFERRMATGLLSPVGFFGQHSHAARLFLKVTFGARFFAANRKWRNIETTIERLGAYEQQLANLDVPLLFIIIPARHQVDPSVHKGSAFVHFLGWDDYLMRQNTELIKHFKKSDVDYLDLLPFLVNQPKPTYFDDDPHTNAYGHLRIAEAIAEIIAPSLPRSQNLNADAP